MFPMSGGTARRPCWDFILLWCNEWKRLEKSMCMQVICTRGCGSIVIVLQLRIAILNHRADLRVRLRFAAVGSSVDCKGVQRQKQVAGSSVRPIFKTLINPLRNVSTYWVWIHHGRELVKLKCWEIWRLLTMEVCSEAKLLFFQSKGDCSQNRKSSDYYERLCKLTICIYLYIYIYISSHVAFPQNVHLRELIPTVAERSPGLLLSSFILSPRNRAALNVRVVIISFCFCHLAHHMECSINPLGLSRLFIWKRADWERERHTLMMAGRTVYQSRSSEPIGFVSDSLKRSLQLQGSLLVRGATLAACERPVANRDAPQCWTKL